MMKRKINLEEGPVREINYIGNIYYIKSKKSHCHLSPTT